QRAAQPEQPLLVQLRRAGGPAELVVAVAPDVAADEDRDGHVRQSHPQDHVHGAECHALPLAIARPYGSRPTCSCSGPVAAKRATAVRSRLVNAGSVAVTESMTSAHGDRASCKPSRSSSSPARCSTSRRRPASGAQEANSSTTAR